MTGSKVLTDPVELGPELVELFRERLLFVGHRGMVARGALLGVAALVRRETRQGLQPALDVEPEGELDETGVTDPQAHHPVLRLRDAAGGRAPVRRPADLHPVVARRAHDRDEPGRPQPQHGGTRRADDERDMAKLRDAVKRMNISFPVVADNRQKIWTDYRCDVWPTQFVIDRKGVIRVICSNKRHKQRQG